MSRCAAAFVAALVAAASARPATQQKYSQNDIDSGAKLYGSQCATCHGPNGNSIGAVDLGSNKFRRATSDQDLMNLIKAGIPDAGMPSHDFTPLQLTGLVAYLRNMRNAAGIAAALGDARRGQEIFEGKGDCLSCHSLNGRGTHAAPDLSNLGSARPADLIQKVLLSPSAALVPINRPVRAVTKDGTVINGRRLNEDTFTVQLADERGRLVSLVKSELREFTILTTARMPSYQGKLSSGEVANLLAYLLTLQGSRP